MPQFRMAEVSLGLVPDLGGTARLVRLVGYQRALEICATGRHVRADEAVRIGLALVSVPLAELDAAVADLAAAIVESPAPAVRAITALMQRPRQHRGRATGRRAGRADPLARRAGAGRSTCVSPVTARAQSRFTVTVAGSSVRKPAALLRCESISGTGMVAVSAPLQCPSRRTRRSQAHCNNPVRDGSSASSPSSSCRAITGDPTSG